MRGLLESAVPFARFQIERTLERARDDEALSEVAGVIRSLPQGILRGELVQIASSRLGITPELVESAVRTARAGRAPGPGDGGAHPAPPTALARRSTAASRPSGPSSRSASRCPSSARRSWGPSTSTPCSARPPPPGRRAAARPPRHSVLDPRRGARPRRPRRGAPRHRQPPRRHPGDARARGAPARPPPPRPRDQRRPNRGRGSDRSPRDRAPEGPRRDPASPAVEPKVRPTHELVFVSWTRTGSKTQLAAGRSIESIAREVGKHPSTVGYGSRSTACVDSCGQACRARRRRTARRSSSSWSEGMSVRQIGEELGLGFAAVQYWLAKYDLKTRAPPLLAARRRRRRRRCSASADGTAGRSGSVRAPGLLPLSRLHGSERVAAYRRRVKRALVEEAGGRCVAVRIRRLRRRAPVPPPRPTPEALRISRAADSPDRSNRCVKRRGNACYCAQTATRRSRRGSWKWPSQPILRGRSVRGSSTAERSAVNRWVVGSSPTPGASQRPPSEAAFVVLGAPWPGPAVRDNNKRLTVSAPGR